MNKTIPKTLYHITHHKTISNILKEGLVAGYDYILADSNYDNLGVNLVDSTENFPLGFNSQQITIEVDTLSLDPEKFIYFGKGWYRYQDSISPDKFIQLKPEVDNK